MSTKPNTITGLQCRMARAGLRWSVRDLAEKAQTAVSTINRFEVGRATPHPRTLAAVREVMEEAGARFDGIATVTVRAPRCFEAGADEDEAEGGE